MFSFTNSLFDQHHGSCPNCGKNVAITEENCPYCLHRFNSEERLIIRKSVSEHQEKIKPYTQVWNILGLVVFVLSLISILEFLAT